MVMTGSIMVCCTIRLFYEFWGCGFTDANFQHVGILCPHGHESHEGFQQVVLTVHSWPRMDAWPVVSTMRTSVKAAYERELSVASINYIPFLEVQPFDFSTIYSALKKLIEIAQKVISHIYWLLLTWLFT